MNVKLPVFAKSGTHYLDGRLQNRPIDVHLAGAGGTGSQVLTGLARLHLALRALGHPFGLQVEVWDRDAVSPSNVGRQLFSPADIGQGKAVTLVHRLNCFFGLNWRARDLEYEGHEAMACDVLITCIDSAAGRREIAANLRDVSPDGPYPYWLDCGNAKNSGQVFLGKGKDEDSRPVMAGTLPVQELMAGAGIKPHCPLPAIWDILPETFEEGAVEDNTPSCSLAESLGHQDLFINQQVATLALELLWRLLRDGKLSVHGYWINMHSERLCVAPVVVPVGNGKAKRGRCRKGATNG